jgi:acyl dehydratase
MPATRRHWEDVKEGDRLPEVRVEKLTRTDFVRYAGASGDFNPIHHDQTFAEDSGNPTVFAMGMLNAGILSRVVTAYAGRPAVRRFKVRFVTRAWPGDDVVCSGVVTRKLEAGGEKRVEGDLVAVNQKGETLIAGSFAVALPSRGGERPASDVR